MVIIFVIIKNKDVIKLKSLAQQTKPLIKCRDNSQQLAVCQKRGEKPNQKMGKRSK